MKRVCLTAALLLSLAVQAEAFSDRAVTLFLDGAQVEQRESFRKGYLEVTVPPGALLDSFRIAPDKGVEIRRVITAPQKPDKNVAKELGQLAEREEQLNARLKALTVREEIFKAAAKSQSAKAPRRTKTNPEPLTTIRQGTDYAITQLESVYQAQRKVEKELAQISERRLRLGKEELSGGTVARVWLSPASGGVTLSWNESGNHWSPLYQLRIDDKGGARLLLMARELSLAKGEHVSLVLGPLNQAGDPLRFRYDTAGTVLKQEPVQITTGAAINSSPYRLSFTNSSDVSWPSGEITCFMGGVYIGKGRFSGVASGQQGEVVCSGS